jgi:hypothetical protein
MHSLQCSYMRITHVVPTSKAHMTNVQRENLEYGENRDNTSIPNTDYCSLGNDNDADRSFSA